MAADNKTHSHESRTSPNERVGRKERELERMRDRSSEEDLKTVRFLARPVEIL
jgi:hypothetical protein